MRDAILWIVAVWFAALLSAAVAARACATEPIRASAVAYRVGSTPRPRPTPDLAATLAWQMPDGWREGEPVVCVLAPGGVARCER